jgi:hypothetical protein
VLQLLVTVNVILSSLILVILMIETAVLTRATWHNIPEDGSLHNQIYIPYGKLRLTTVGDTQRWPRDTPLSIKVGTKFYQEVAVAQSV